MHQSITLMGMSGVGKTNLSRKLPNDKWFHYSSDYRIASHYLNDEIGDFLKREAMKSPLIAHLLKSDSIYIGSNLSVDNLAPVSAFIGKLGKRDLGGLDLATFSARQRLHYKAEIAALYDIGYFKQRANNLYGYNNFLHDAGGSICEIEDEKIIDYIAAQTDFIYIHADEKLASEITQRALDYPKPLYYNADFLNKQLANYKAESGASDVDDIIPDEFIHFVIPRLMHHRSERYLAIAEKYGKVVDANLVFQVRDEADFLELLERD